MAVIDYLGIRYDTLYGGGHKSGKAWYQQNKSEIAVQPSPTKPQEDLRLTPLTVTENGGYTPPEGYAYSGVSVNVPQPVLEDLTVTENGTYEGQYKKVVVDVEGTQEATAIYHTSQQNLEFVNVDIEVVA